MRNVHARQATLADIDALTQLLDQYRQFQGRASDLASARAFLQARFDHGESVVFLALADGAPAGIAQLYPIFSTIALARAFILNDLYVSTAFRRVGVAGLLLQAIEDYGWSMGAARLTLNVARVNEQAQALYRARGWRQDEDFFMFNRHPQRSSET